MSAAGSSAVEHLRGRYAHRHAAALDAHRAGKRVVGVTSHTVPLELISAAGMFPLLLSPDDVVADGAADGRLPHEIYMEDVFDARTRAIFDFLVSGNGSFLTSVIIPRTSEREHKLFLYLREIHRQENRPLPDVYLYNMLHARSDDSREYSLGRTKELKHHLQKLAGREITASSMEAAIAAGNRALAAARKLVTLRESGKPTLSGADALALLGARYFMDAAEYAKLATEAAVEVEQFEPMKGPRVLIKGVPLHHAGLHRQIEAAGAVVVGEDDAWGSRSAMPDIATTGDPLEAIFDHYYSHTFGPRVFPLAVADQWFYERAAQVDGVIFNLPQEDEVLGWDYPRQRGHLDPAGVPHLLIRSEEASQSVADFVMHLRKKRES